VVVLAGSAVAMVLGSLLSAAPARERVESFVPSNLERRARAAEPA